MAIDVHVPRTRRALLAGGIGGSAALMASALGRPLPAVAAEPYVGLGQTNTSGATTLVENATTANPPLKGKCTAGDGLVGETAAANKSGVYGFTTANSGYGVFGRNTATGTTGYLGGYSRGVRGESASGTGVHGGSSSGTGVYGGSSSGTGLYASSDSGIGVDGFSSTGIGVRAYSGTVNAIYARAYGTEAAILARAYGGTTGVLGYSGPGSAPVAPAKTGVYGYAAQDAASVGVRGASALGDGIVGASAGPGKSGVYGYSTVAGGYGIVGRNHVTVATGALGSGTTGVHGTSVAHSGVAGTSGAGSPAFPAATGVYGFAAQNANASGVHGRSTGGRGVYGQATSGSGVRGQATTGTAVYAATGDPLKGYALRAIGRVKLDNCAGVTTLAAGTKVKTVTPGIDLVGTSSVVATLQGNAGAGTTVERVLVDASDNKFTIYLTKNSTADVKVAWHVFG